MNRYFYDEQGIILYKLNYRTGGSPFVSYPLDYFEREEVIDIDTKKYDAANDAIVDR